MQKNKLVNEYCPLQHVDATSYIAQILVETSPERTQCNKREKKDQSINHMCAHCNHSHKGTPAIHKLFECAKFEDQRGPILNSIQTELDHLMEQNNPKHDIIYLKNEVYELIKYPLSQAIIDKAISHHHWIFIDFIVGNLPCVTSLKVEELGSNAPEIKFINKVTNLFKTHFAILANLVQKDLIASPMDDWTEIKEHVLEIRSNEIRLETHLIATQNIRLGKVLCVRKSRQNTMIPINIRRLVRALPQEYQGHFSMGLGNASTRSHRQKREAKIFTQQILNDIPRFARLYSTDGSVISVIDSIGGYGGCLWVDGKEVWFESRPLRTASPAEAELRGILNCLRHATDPQVSKQFRKFQWRKNQIHIVCDCKYAVNVANGIVNPSKKDLAVAVDIGVLIDLLITKGISVTIHWIPGHVDIDINNRADELARQGANLCLKEKLGNKNHNHIEDDASCNWIAMYGFLQKIDPDIQF